MGYREGKASVLLLLRIDYHWNWNERVATDSVRKIDEQRMLMYTIG